MNLCWLNRREIAARRSAKRLLGAGSLPALLAGGAALTLASSAIADTFSFTGFLTSYTVPQSGLYDILVKGAQGGSGQGASGGSGATVDGGIFLTGGSVLRIVVGGAGHTGTFSDGFGGGGGGGSFVFVTGAAQPLIVGGGGGGAAYTTNSGRNGQTGTSGQAGGGASGGAGGANGAGGAGGKSVFGSGGGGGGWSGNGTAGGGGANADNGDGGFGPAAFAGGSGATDGTSFASGGFGGGGGGGLSGGGGGGGYSGGGGGDGSNAFPGGGGGSYGAAAFTGVTFGLSTGNGAVTITSLGVADTPEPGTWAFLGSSALTGAAFLRRRRRQAREAC